jgi:H/ACA ribonucleoprotein complex subunit 2
MDQDNESTNHHVELYKNPISEPMATEKLTLKLLKLTKKLANIKLIRRGVKEVNKAFRKKEKGVCILAGDVSPIDVISHIPILSQKNKIPYVFVPSREALGENALTKRPTSVVILLKPEKDHKYRETYDKLVEVIKVLHESQ